MSFDFEEERVKQGILKLNARRVLIQLPEGLKPEALRLAKIVESAGALPIISADPCYGACDLATEDAESLGVDLIVHHGHSKLLKYERVPTLYVEARATVAIDTAVQEALPLLGKLHKIGLATTVQYVQRLDEAREILIRAGKTVMIGDAGKLSYPGQVIGCDYSNVVSVSKNVEAFLFVGGGRFHAIGIALSSSKPTVVADPYENRAYSVNSEVERIIKQQWANVSEAKKAKTFAVLVGLKQGQKRLEKALEVKQKLEQIEKKVILLAAREISPEMLLEFPAVDAYVNTACPRVSIDYAPKFRKPILTVGEALVIVGELSWEELCRRGLSES